MRRPSRPSELLPSRRATRSLPKRDALERRAQDELARVEDERLAVGDLDELGQVLLSGLRIDVRRVVVAEDAEVAIRVEVDRRGLDRVVGEWLDDDAAVVERFFDLAVGEDHWAAQCMTCVGRSKA